MPRHSKRELRMSNNDKIISFRELDPFLIGIIKLCDTLPQFRNSFWCNNCRDYTPHKSIKSYNVANNAASKGIICPNYNNLYGIGEFNILGITLSNIVIRAFECEKCAFMSLHSNKNEIVF